MKSISRIEWDVIEARVRLQTEKYNFNQKTLGFLALALQQIFPGIDDILHEVITDGPDDRGVDAVHIIEREESAEIYIFQCKYRDSYTSSNKTVNDAEILKLDRFLNEIFEKNTSLNSIGNFRLKESVLRIWDIHEKGKLCRYQIIVCSNGEGFSSSALQIIKNIKERNSLISYEFYSGYNVIQAIFHENKIQENGQLQVIGNEILERSDGNVRGAVASVEAKSLVSLITEEDNETIKRHIFDDNLRVFLGSKGGFNQSIISTATSNDRHLFWYLNNRITIICKNFSYNKGHSSPKLIFENFQIVNGAQTSHSLVEAARINPHALQDVVVMVRIYATERSDIAERVAVATNSQARIQSRDLVSNHKTLMKLELGFNEKGYFFERKKNMHFDKQEERRIDSLKLGQAIMSFYLHEPDRAKTESDSIFDVKFSQIFGRHDRIDDLINLYNIYRIVENLRDQYQSSFGSSPESGNEHRYLIYGNWFVIFACSLILQKANRNDLPTGNDARKLVDNAIMLVAAACNQQKAVAHYQMFRSSRTKDRIAGEIMGKQPDLFDKII